MSLYERAYAPATVTAREIRDLMWVGTATDAAISVSADGVTMHLGDVANHIERGMRVLVRASEIRPLLASVTKHVDRLFAGEIVTLEGATLAALLVNEQHSAVVDGKPVTVIEPAE